MLDFLKKNWLVLILLIALLVQAATSAQLWARLQNERVATDLMKAALDAEKNKAPTIINFQPPSGPPIDLKVTLEPSPSGGLPKVVVDAPPILCKTEAECREKFGQAQQTVSVDAAFRIGTVVPVCLVDLINGKCPEGQTANRPLSAAVPFHLDLIRLTGGAYTALQPKTGALEITNVRTRTEPITATILATGQFPYHLYVGAKAIVATSGITAMGGLFYRNLGLGGAYEIGIGPTATCAPACTAGFGIMLGFEVPIR